MIILKNIVSRGVVALLLFLFLFSCKTVEEKGVNNYTKFTGLGFTVELPPGFEYEKYQELDKPVASYTFFSPKRADTFIRIDIYSAKYTKDLDKVVDENLKFFERTGSIIETELDRIRTKYYNYNASDEVTGRVYFLLYQDHLYRIILNWHKSSEAEYLPQFEKSINSLKLNL